MKLTAIIVEDEQTSRDILKNYIAKYCAQVEILNEATNVEEAFVLLQNTEVDLVFLDVEMPYGTAFDLLDKLPLSLIDILRCRRSTLLRSRWATSLQIHS